MASRVRRGATKALRVLIRPVRRAQGYGGKGRGGLVVEPYRGYGSHDEIFLIGRVFRQSPGIPGEDPESLRAQWRDLRRRIARRKVAGAAVTARFGGDAARVETDRDGYFRLNLHPRSLPTGAGEWHGVELVLEADPPIPAQGAVFIPPSGCRYVVVSDIDDTVMRTGVANKLKMLWRLFVEDAESRVAFPGVAALYRALHAGAGGDEGNPMLYVSRAPWGLYEMLSEFFQRHGIPAGPVLFLREWGLSWTHPLPRRATDHKQALIRHMLALYRDLPFVLIGDSGQHDPEVYAQIVEENPGRVLAVYIRNVSRYAGRIEEIVRLAGAVARAGSSLVLAADSVAVAEHAASLGLIAPEAVAGVADEHAADAETGPRRETARIIPGPPGSDGDAVDAPIAPEAIADALAGDGAVPATVVVAPTAPCRRPSWSRLRSRPSFRASDPDPGCYRRCCPPGLTRTARQACAELALTKWCNAASRSEGFTSPSRCLGSGARMLVHARSVRWSPFVQTYTLAIADGVLFACLPDEADITAAITDATATNYGFGLSLDIVRGATLTDAARPGDEVVWQEGPDSELLDAHGRRYRYAVRRLS